MEQLREAIAKGAKLRRITERRTSWRSWGLGEVGEMAVTWSHKADDDKTRVHLAAEQDHISDSFSHLGNCFVVHAGRVKTCCGRKEQIACWPGDEDPLVEIFYK